MFQLPTNFLTDITANASDIVAQVFPLAALLMGILIALMVVRFILFNLFGVRAEIDDIDD